MTNLFIKIRQNHLILPFYAPSMLFAAAMAMLIPIMPLYAGSFNVPYLVIGAALAAEAFGTLIGDVPAGMLLRKLGQKRAMLIGICLATLATVSLFWINSIWLVLLCRFIGGMGIALYGVARVTYLSSAVSIAKRGRATSIFGGMYRMGNFLGPAIGGFVAGALGLRVPFLVFGLFGIAALTMVILFFKEPAIPVTQHTSLTGHLWITLRENYQILLSAGAGQVLGMLIRAGRVAIIPLYAADVLHLDIETIGLLLSISNAIDMLMFYPAGMVMDHFGRKYAIVPCFAGQGIGMLLIPFTTGFLPLLLVTSLMSFANGIGSGSMMTLGSDLAPPESRGEFLGVWRLIGDIGATGGPLLVGGIADLLVLSAAALVLAGAGLGAAGIFALRVPETLHKKKRPAVTVP